jgi:hypothetical protein
MDFSRAQMTSSQFSGSWNHSDAKKMHKAEPSLEGEGAEGASVPPPNLEDYLERRTEIEIVIYKC